MNIKIPAARGPSPLVRVWRPTGETGMPLVCHWVTAKTTKLQMNSDDLKGNLTGGLRLCA